MRILVTGATGYVGSRLIPALLAAGHEVIAASRNPNGLKRFGWYDKITPVELDAGDADNTRRAFQQASGVDVVYYLVHGIGQPDFRDADNRAATTVAEAARDAGVRRIVYLGGFTPEEELSEHLASRAEVADALYVDNGPEVVWLGAAIILGAGSTSFEMLRYVADRFVVIPSPSWMDNPMDPISVRDVLYYLEAAGDPDRVPAGAYDITGPESSSYRKVIQTYIHAAGKKRAVVPLPGIDTAIVSKVTALALPVPGGLAADLVESLDYPMTASGSLLRDLVPDPPGGLTTTESAIEASLSSAKPCPVNKLADVHHLADTDPDWAGGDALRIRRLARPVTLPIARPALGLVDAVPGPVAGALRTGLDLLADLVPDVDKNGHR